MNWKIKNWFWTQYLVVIGFVAIYLIMSLHPWYYNLSYVQEGQEIEGQEEVPLNFRQAMIMRAGTNKIGQTEEDLIAQQNQTALERKYANGAKMSSLDLLIVFSYMVSISYVLGMFLSNTKNSILVNVPIFVLLMIKSIWIMQGTKAYKLAIKNVLYWWIGLGIYLILFVIHNKVVITEVEKEELKDGIGITR